MAITTALPATIYIKPRTVLVASADSSFRQRLSAVLSGLRWQVREAHGGAQAWGEAMDIQPETIVVDSWLPDLDVHEFLREFHASFPKIDIVTNDLGPLEGAVPSPFRQEVLYALRHLEQVDTAAWNSAPSLGDDGPRFHRRLVSGSSSPNPVEFKNLDQVEPSGSFHSDSSSKRACVEVRIPELVGDSERMLEVSRRIRKVAPLDTSVLIEGPTGSGKEIVATALHRMSSRSRKPFVAINCAAIPEALLEAGVSRSYEGSIHRCSTGTNGAYRGCKWRGIVSR